MKMLSKQSIGNKLLLLNIFAIFFAVFIAGFIWSHIALSEYERYFNQRISNQITLVANNLSAAVMFEDWGEVDVILSALKADDAILSARIFPNNSELGQESGSMDNAYQLEMQARPNQNRHLAWTFKKFKKTTGSKQIPINAGNNDIAILEVQYHTNEIYTAFIRVLYSILSITLLLLTITTLILFKLQRLVTGPIHSLSILAREVTKSQNYSLRGTAVFEDEVGQLTEDFNLMLDIIESRDSDLENIVWMRTKELESKNFELKHEIEERAKSEVEKREVLARFEKAFINAPIGMALIDTNEQIFRANSSLTTTLKVNQNRQLYLNEFINDEGYQTIHSKFEALVSGKLSSFESNVDCFDAKGNWMAAILSFSSVRNDEDQFRYAVLQLQNITESKKLSLELEFLARHDALTSLPNRRVLKDAITELCNIELIQPSALAILDLDQFKIVNDTCGHIAGDELLCQIASIIKSSAREGDLVVRLGGDEFAILFKDCDKEIISDITESIREIIGRWEYRYQNNVFRIGVSIGVVIIEKRLLEPSELMKKADAACFIAKDLGRNYVHIVDGEDSEVLERQREISWVQRIHNALENDDMLLYAQSIVPLNSDKKSTRKEILLRLFDRENNIVVPPGAFIPSAERYGLMHKIDLFVVNKLIMMLKQNPLLCTAGQTYWVNLSGLSLSSKNFLLELENVLRSAELPSGCINFEITETAVMSNISEAKKFMESIRSIGCQFALDDFGSGMSSFGYLKNLPVDYIKIDGMFVRDITKNEIDLIFVKSIIDIANVMGIETIAEYVESSRIKEVLKELGANYGQGYAIDRPAPLDKDMIIPPTNLKASQKQRVD